MKPMSEENSGDWKAASWAGAEAARRVADRKLSFRQKLEWNAQALALAKQLKKRRSKWGVGSLVPRRLSTEPLLTHDLPLTHA